MKQHLYQNPSKSISHWRKLLFITITLSIPVLFFILVELCLRLFDYGPNLSLFTTKIVAGKSYYAMNPSVKNRYFSRFDFSPSTSPELFLVAKPAGTFRIFCLGGSTTVGYPYWYNGAFSSFLRDRLQAVFPDRAIEIVNIGMTATNSYTVLDLGKELLKYGPDLFIVYDGHNEFYGALGAASNERGAPARWMTLLKLRLIHLRTYQFARNTISSLFSALGKTPVDYSNRATMMEQVARGRNVPYGSDAYVQGLSTFRQNLRTLAERCQNRRIPLFLSTQVSNLRDQLPFVSNNSPELSQPQRSRFQQVYSGGLALQAKGLVDSAIVIFRSAIALDSLHAEAHYRLAQCLEIVGKKQEAYPEYILARDFDELRFRTDSRFNNLIRSMADNEDCFVADIETVFKSLSQDSLVGHNLILEHLHPNARGHFLMAKEYARLMREHGLLASPGEWARCDTLSDDFLWNNRRVTAVDEFIASQRTEYLTSGWPFKNQPPIAAAIAKTDTLQAIAEQAIRGQIDWTTAHRHAAEYYLRRGDRANAVREFETIINQLPLDVAAYLRIARLHFERSAFSRAEAVLLASLQVEQTSIAYRALGDTYMKQGKIENAIRSYERLAAFTEDPATAPENACVLALAYLVSEKPEPAIRILEQTVNRYPAYTPARDLLTKVRLMSGSTIGK